MKFFSIIFDNLCNELFFRKLQKQKIKVFQERIKRGCPSPRDPTRIAESPSTAEMMWVGTSRRHGRISRSLEAPSRIPTGRFRGRRTVGSRTEPLYWIAPGSEWDPRRLDTDWDTLYLLTAVGVKRYARRGSDPIPITQLAPGCS